MDSQELDREEQWIAKYRAALDVCPEQPSVFRHLTLNWENAPKFTKLSPIARHFTQAIDRIQSLKLWVAARSQQILRSKKHKIAH
jgi:hypothetical protein